MFKYLIIGLGISFIAVIVGLVSGDWFIALQISGVVSIAGFIVSGLFLGVFISGDKIRANYHSESNKDRRRRTRMAQNIFMIVVPNLILSIILTANLY